MLINDDRRLLSGVTAATVTTAAFSKLFLPFYLIGSTAIFVATSVIGVALLAASWRPIYQMAMRVADIFLLVIAFYVFVILNFLFLSRPVVPTTHLLGILIFHSLFMVFGFATARSLRVFLMMLLGAAAFYVVVIAQYTVRFGDLMQAGYLHDIFGVGNQPLPALYGDQPVPIYIAFHQKIGILLGLAALAALGLASNRIKRFLAIGAFPLILLFMFHISARGAMVALLCSLIFLVIAELWSRSKKQALLSALVLIVSVAFASGMFYAYAVQDKGIDPKAPDAISRTMREIQSDDPGFRLPIWSETWHRIVAEPNRLLFGRGIGMYPVNEGYGPPDWLLRTTKASHVYPHNAYLEMLYETGIAGLLVFSFLTLFPLAISLTRWHLFSLSEKAVFLMYSFQFASSQFSGSFAFSFLDQFFFALTLGIVALARTDRALVLGPFPSKKSRDQNCPKPDQTETCVP